jgi:hypothetical protein
MLLVPATHSGTSSAAALMAKWRDADGFPAEVSRLMRSHDTTASATMLLAIPEHRVRLAAGARAAQTDLWVLAWTPRGLLSIVVDAGRGDAEDMAAGEGQTAASHARTTLALRSLLEIDRESDLAIGHRFFHRTACALLEARRFFATSAAVVVHSLGATRQTFLEFQAFVALMGGLLVRPGELAPVPPREGIALYFGWAEG